MSGHSCICWHSYNGPVAIVEDHRFVETLSGLGSGFTEDAKGDEMDET